MENFIADGEFYIDIETLVEQCFDEEDITLFSDDFKIEAFECRTEPLFMLTADFICEAINEERFSEDGDEYEKIEKILSANIDFDRINVLIPKMYYPDYKKRFYITKADLLEAIN